MGGERRAARHGTPPSAPAAAPARPPRSFPAAEGERGDGGAGRARRFMGVVVFVRGLRLEGRKGDFFGGNSFVSRGRERLTARPPSCRDSAHRAGWERVVAPSRSRCHKNGGQPWAPQNSCCKTWEREVFGFTPPPCLPASKFRAKITPLGAHTTYA